MKQFLIKLDQLFFSSKLRRLNTLLKVSKIKNKINKRTNFEIKINYNNNKYNNNKYNNLFHNLCKKYNCDKSLIDDDSHNYSEIYFNLFNARRKGIKRIFECGIGTKNKNFPFYMNKKKYKTGASLYVWRDFFPNAEIIAGDIDKSVLFSSKRIKTFHLDQLDKKSIKTMLSNFKKKEFDIIIDDGDHRFKSGISLFENTYHKISKNGYYIIEDVSFNDFDKYVDYFQSKNLNVKFYQIKVSDLKVKNDNLKTDNNLIIIHKI